MLVEARFCLDRKILSEAESLIARIAVRPPNHPALAALRARLQEAAPGLRPLPAPPPRRLSSSGGHRDGPLLPPSPRRHRHHRLWPRPRSIRWRRSSMPNWAKVIARSAPAGLSAPMPRLRHSGSTGSASFTPQPQHSHLRRHAPAPNHNYAASAAPPAHAPPFRPALCRAAGLSTRTAAGVIPAIRHRRIRPHCPTPARICRTARRSAPGALIHAAPRSPVSSAIC